MPDPIQSIQSDGIYHGLPVLPASLSGLRAVVVGASGMSGQSMINVLAKDSKRWKDVYALSRRPPKLGRAVTNVTHVSVDFLKEPQTVADILTKSGVKADYVFFFGYVQLSPEERAYSSARHDSADKLTETNGRLLRNFLTALEIASITPKRILLQTGLKYYGAHHGPINVPCEERDPRVELGESNFYYAQEDILSEHCRTHPSISYTITMPSWILGAVEASDMTTFYPLAVYATVQRKLKQPFAFPGDSAAFEKIMPMSSAVLNSLFHEWVILEESAKGELFNIVDDSQFTWLKAWPIIAGWFGLEPKGPKEEDEASYTVTKMPLRPRGYGPHGHCRSSFNLVEWSKQPENRQAWKELAEEAHLTSDSFSGSDGMFAALQFSLIMSWSWATSMNKARKFGWHGHVDTMESMREVFDKFVEFKMIPPMST